MSAVGLTLSAMWESPTALWRRLRLGREEYLQRLVTTLILDGDTPPWTTQRSPGEAGRAFLRLLDEVAHGPQGHDRAEVPARTFVDEYLLPKLDEDAANGWPDWAVLWPDRVWIIELKTETGSHRADQLPYYLRLAAAAHTGCTIDLTYITGPLTKPAPALLEGQRYSHLTWDQVVPLVEEAWGHDARPEVATYVEMVNTLVGNLSRLNPLGQRQIVLGALAGEPSAVPVEEPAITARIEKPAVREPDLAMSPEPPDLLELARGTASDGRQRAVGAQDPEELEALHGEALAAIGSVAADDRTRFVLPWLWDAGRTGGRPLTVEGDEFGFELRFSRYKKVQVTA